MSRSTRFILTASCLATLLVLHSSTPSDALLLSGFIGCNSFGCRISALETDVAQLKQQMARLDPSGQMQGMNNFQRPNMPFNQNMNNLNPQQQQQQQQQQLQQQQMQNGQQQNNGQGTQTTQPRQGEDGRVSYALDYPMVNSQNLRRNPNYPIGLNNGLNNGQFMNM